MPSVADNSIHYLYDHLGWLLLPEKDIIEMYYNALTFLSGAPMTKRGSFPVIEVRPLYHAYSDFLTG